MSYSSQIFKFKLLVLTKFSHLLFSLLLMVEHHEVYHMQELSFLGFVGHLEIVYLFLNLVDPRTAVVLLNRTEVELLSAFATDLEVIV